MSPYQCELVTKDGRHAFVQRSNKALELVVKTRQGSKRPKVEVFTSSVPQNMEKLAFCFQYNKKTYLPKVDNGAVKLVQKKTTIASAYLSDNSYWFQWKQIGGGRHCLLQSVAEPNKHLFINQENKVVLSSNKQEILLFCRL